MTINIQNASTVKNVKGIHTTYNNKPVMCITTGEIFASVTDAAHSIESSIGTLSCALRHNRPLKGKKWCYLTRVTEHLDELATNIRSTEEKLADYEAMKAKQEEIKRARAEYSTHKANVAELQRKLEEELTLLKVAEGYLNDLVYGND